MMKRRKSDRSDGDLADVNEQELAKTDVREQTDFGADTDIGADIANGGSASVSVCGEKNEGIEPVEAERGEGAEVPSSPDRAELPSRISHGENVKEDIDLGDASPDNGDRENNVRGRAERTHRERGRGYIFITCACMVVSIAILVLTLTGRRTADVGGGSSDTVESETEAVTDTRTEEDTLAHASVYEKCAGVSVTVRAVRDGKAEHCTGIGVFGDGYVATLYQGVADAERVEIVLSDGTVSSASVIGGDATANVALLRSDAPVFSYAEVGSAGSLKAGDGIFVIGNAGDGKYGASLASGVVAFGERTPLLDGFDGHSRRVRAVQLCGSFDVCMLGAPVFNERGEAVAMMLSVDSVSFAFPLEGVCAVLDAVRKGEEPSEEAIYGLAYVPPTLGILGTQVEFEGAWGIAVKGFSDGRSDAAAKLRADDIIFKINGTLTPDAQTLVREIERYRPGEEVEVFVYRSGQRLSFFVKLEKS